MQKDILEVIYSRRSIRKFKNEKLETQLLQQVLKAGLLAPSSMNKKPVEFVVVEDRETLQQLKTCKNPSSDAYNTASCAIVVIADSQKSDVWVEDASIASTMMQLEAESLGIGSVWIQMRNRKSLTGGAEEAVRTVLNIPEKYGVLDILVLGYKDEFKEPYSEDSLNFTAVHYDNF